MNEKIIARVQELLDEIDPHKGMPWFHEQLWSALDPIISSPAITLTIFDDAEAWLHANLPDMSTNSVACVRPVSDFNLDGLTEYEDTEDVSTDRASETNEYGTLRKSCDMQAHVRALQLLCEQIGHTLFVGGVKSPYALVDPSNWDNEVVDAYYQLVMLEEVVYG